MANQKDQRVTKKAQNIRLPLIGSMTNRSYSSTKDQRFVNIFPETRKVDQIESTKIFLNKRPGLTTYKDFGTGEGRGIIYFNSKLYVVIGNTVYEDGVSPTAKITLTGSTGHVGLIVANSSYYGDYLFVCDGTSAWTIDSAGTASLIDKTKLISVVLTAAGSGYTNGTYSLGFSGGGGSGAAGTYTVAGNVVTSISISNYGTGYTSAPTVSFPSGGGTGAAATAQVNTFPSPHIPTPIFIDGYILLAKDNDIYNCVLDEPSQWESSNYISAELFPDRIKALGRQNNQVVAFGSHSVEFFYDAANPSASPLSRNEGTTLQMGIAAPYALYQSEKNLIYIGQSESGGRAVWMVEGFQPKRVSDEFVDRILDSEIDMSDVRGYGIRTMGHLFFVVNLPTQNRTLVYDVDEKLWHEWSTNVSSSHSVFEYNYMTDTQQGFSYLQHISNGILYTLDPTSYQDNSNPMIVEIVTNKFDMDTINRKFQTNLRIVGDRYETGNSIDVRWTDDDYNTWSNWKTINLTDDFPNFARMGQFRRRAYNLKHVQNYPLRLEALEVSFREGNH